MRKIQYDLLQGCLAGLEDANDSYRLTKEKRISWIPNVLSNDASRRCIEVLEKNMLNHLKEYRHPIPKDSIKKMRRNYSEVLGKTISNRTVILNGNRSNAVKTAKAIGLLDMMKSSCTKAIAENVSGFRLAEDPGCQLICYEEGDNVGPHNDHHPEEDPLMRGYIDLQVTLCNEGVEHQFLVCEQKGLFSTSFNVAVPNAVSVSHLPFWHYVTPLVKKPNVKIARRWLLLCSYEILDN